MEKTKDAPDMPPTNDKKENSVYKIFQGTKISEICSFRKISFETFESNLILFDG